MRERSHSSVQSWPLAGDDAQHLERRRLMRAGTPAGAELSVVDYGGRPAVLKSYAHTGWLFRNFAGALLARREAAAYACLAGVDGVPQLLARFGRAELVVELIDGRNCAGCESAEFEPAFFDRLSVLLSAIRERGVLHGDVKRNVVRAADGAPWLVDFGASFVIGGWLAPLRAFIIRSAASYDARAVAKLKRQVAPHLLTADDHRRLGAAMPFERIVRNGERVLRWGTQWIIRRASRHSDARD